MQIEIQGTANSDRIEHGTADVRELSKDKLFFKALIQITVWWSLAILCILIPALHFILVPACFFLGIFFALRTSKLKVEILSGSINCPHCLKPVSLLQSPATWPHTEICQDCGSIIRLNPL